MKLIYSTLLAILIFTTSAIAQINITGKVVSPSGKPLNSVAVRIVTTATNDEIATTTTNNKGFYKIKVAKADDYTLIFYLSNYNSTSQDIHVTGDMNMEPIALQASNIISGVKVTAEKPIEQISVDKKIYNVGQDATAAGGSASDVLKNVPSVSVDPVDGTLSLRGNQNITVYIDGKPSSMFGDDIGTILQGLPASSIESVEVVNNPGAQYDAQGKGGVLNIILKKDRKAGYNGNIGANIGLPLKANLNLGFNANVGKWNFFANTSGRFSKTNVVETTDRNNLYNDTTTYTNSLTHRTPMNGFANFGFDYNFDKKNKITLSQNLFGGNMAGDVTTNIFSGINYNNIFQTVNRTNEYTGKPRNETTSFNYTHTGNKPGKELKVDASYGVMSYKRTSTFVSDTVNSLGNATSPYYQSIPINGGNNNFTLSTDYKLPISRKSSLEFGGKYVDFYFHSQNNPTYYYNANNIINDVPLQNHYTFTQKTYAAYTNYKLQYNEYSLQAGLRFEDFNYNGTVYQFANPNFTKTFQNLFPSLYLSRKLNKNSDLTLSYTKRVNRPNFFQLVPYIDVSNPQDSSMGNPYLLPEFVHATELSYNSFFGKNAIVASVYYQYNNNLIQRYKRFNANGTTFTQPINLNYGVTYGSEINFKYFIKRNWDANVNLNVFNNVINGESQNTAVATQGWSGFAKLISNYTFNKIWSLQMTSNYQAPAVIAQGKTKAYGNVDLAVKANLLKNLLTLTCSANDIFNTVYQGTIYNTNPIYYQYNYKKNQTRQISIGVQYKFLSKSSNPNDLKPQKSFGKKGMKEENKDIKSRDENLKKDEGGDDNGGGGNKEGGQGAGSNGGQNNK